MSMEPVLGNWSRQPLQYPNRFLAMQRQAIYDIIYARRDIWGNFHKENRQAERKFSGARRRIYHGLKLDGILECPASICITCDRDRHAPEILGRNSMRSTDLYCTCCAIQNLWLAARAEGMGVGWVSILHPRTIKRILQIPSRHQLVAYLSIGYVREFPPSPDLERAGWLKRLPLSAVAFWEQWGQPLPDCTDSSPGAKP